MEHSPENYKILARLVLDVGRQVELEERLKGPVLNLPLREHKKELEKQLEHYVSSCEHVFKDTSYLHIEYTCVKCGFVDDD